MKGFRIVLGVVLVLGVAAGGWAAVHTDWHAFGPATPPEDTPEIDATLATLDSLRLGGLDPSQEPLRFTWSQFQPIEVTAKCVPGKFLIRPGGGFRFPPQPPRKEPPHEFRGVSVFVRVWRKSSLGEGRVAVMQNGSGARVDKHNHLSWSNKLWIPHVPGHYQLEVLLVCQKRHPDGQRERHESPIGFFPLEVLPEEGKKAS